jgi:hypothetical protein
MYRDYQRNYGCKCGFLDNLVERIVGGERKGSGERYYFLELRMMSFRTQAMDCKTTAGQIMVKEG